MHADGKSTLASVSKWNSVKVNWLQSKTNRRIIKKFFYGFAAYKALAKRQSLVSISKDRRTCLRRCIKEDFKAVNISIEIISCEISKLVIIRTI